MLGTFRSEKATCDLSCDGGSVITGTQREPNGIGGVGLASEIWRIDSVFTFTGSMGGGSTRNANAIGTAPTIDNSKV